MLSQAALRSHLVLMLVSRLVGGTSCPPERLVVYKMELQTFWDEQTFPKQYPQVDGVQINFEADNEQYSEEKYILKSDEFILSGVQVLSGPRQWVSFFISEVDIKVSRSSRASPNFQFFTPH